MAAHWSGVMEVGSRDGILGRVNAREFVIIAPPRTPAGSTMLTQCTGAVVSLGNGQIPCRSQDRKDDAGQGKRAGPGCGDLLGCASAEGHRGKSGEQCKEGAGSYSGTSHLQAPVSPGRVMCPPGSRQGLEASRSLLTTAAPAVFDHGALPGSWWPQTRERWH